MTKNNVSRAKAKELAASFGWTKEGNGNFFRSKQGDFINITLCDNKIESRQFRKDCTHLVVMNSKDDNVLVYNRSDLEIGSVTRIGPDGVVYYQAKVML